MFRRFSNTNRRKTVRYSRELTNASFGNGAEERNIAIAVKYDKLGMAEYQAMELFVRYHFEKE